MRGRSSRALRRWPSLALAFASVAIAQAPAPTCDPKATPPTAMATFALVAETLYQAQQFDSAAIVVRLGLGSCGATNSDLARLHVLDGILKVEALKDQEAQAAFIAALALNGDPPLPAFTPPRARRLFEAAMSEQQAASAELAAKVLAELDIAFDSRGDGAIDSKMNERMDRLVAAGPQNFEHLWRAARFKAWYASVAVKSVDRQRATNEAIELGDRAAALAPGEVHGHYFAALGLLRYIEQMRPLTLMAEGIEAKIRVRIERANKIDPSFDHGAPLLVMGRYLALLPQPDLARSRDLLAKLVKVYPDNAWAHAYLAETLEKLGRIGDARVEAEKADPLSIKNAAEAKLLADFVAKLKRRNP